MRAQVSPADVESPERSHDSWILTRIEHRCVRDNADLVEGRSLMCQSFSNTPWLTSASFAALG